MEILANINQRDINNGVLIRMLASAGIPDVQEYVKNFHQETEELIIEEFEHSDPNKVDNDEQIVPPADIQNWITGFRPHSDDSIQPPLPEEQKKQLPQDVQSWIMNLRPVIDDSVHISSNKQQPKKQQPQQLPSDVQGWIAGLRLPLDDPVQPLPAKQQPPTDLKSWMQHMAPKDSHPSTDTTTSETTTTSDHHTTLSGNLGTWLNDWSKSLAEQPPPASLDNWLQRLIPKDINEPISKANTPKGRLNSYLNAAQEGLSQHGYNVSNTVTPPTNLETKTKRFGNVRQMYFLVSINLILSVFFYLSSI
jgi:hypothetical protein